jgi:hypothetical protein
VECVESRRRRRWSNSGWTRSDGKVVLRHPGQHGRMECPYWELHAHGYKFFDSRLSADASPGFTSLFSVRLLPSAHLLLPPSLPSVAGFFIIGNIIHDPSLLGLRSSLLFFGLISSYCFVFFLW